MGNTEAERVAEQAATNADVISFSFRGFVAVRRSELRPRDAEGKLVDVSGLTTGELVMRLESQYTIALGDHLYSNVGSEIEMSDFESEPKSNVCH